MATQVELIKKYGLKIKGMIGQHLLIDPNTQRKIVDLLQIKQNDLVLEIGPGLGAITGFALEFGCKLTAVEKDENFVHVLNSELKPIAGERFEVIHQDILEFDFKKFVLGKKKVKVISNIPYYITASILMYLAENSVNIDRAVLMMQKEVAERLTSKPKTKEYGRLTLAMQMVAKTTHAFNVSASCFTPKPEVDSSVVTLDFFEKPRATHPEKVLKLIKIAFSQRRKTLAGLLTAALPDKKRAEIDSLFKELGFSKTVRGEELPLDDYIHLSERLY